ncbi:MAG: hypothetical protein Q7V63_09760 [Gammaproteobacteria bacterium]|nr:hypothetical protein [Gammaproteobacteria bacterium]
MQGNYTNLFETPVHMVEAPRPSPMCDLPGIFSTTAAFQKIGENHKSIRIVSALMSAGAVAGANLYWGELSIAHYTCMAVGITYGSTAVAGCIGCYVVAPVVTNTCCSATEPDSH